MKTIQLTDFEAQSLTILLNIELRNQYISIENARELNVVFRQLTGEDHDSMEDREAHAKLPLIIA